MFKNWISGKNFEIIEFLRKQIFSGFSIIQFEKNINLSHHPTYRRIKQLEKARIILHAEGNYRLNLKNPETIETLYFLSRFDKLNFINSFKNDLFKKLEKQFCDDTEIESAIIFGSYARKQWKKTSDLDIFIVSKNSKINKCFETMYKIKSSFIFATKDEFIRMIKDKKNIIKDLFTEGIILKGNVYKVLSENNNEW